MSVANVINEINLAESGGNTAVADFGAEGIKADVIAEKTAAAGVTIDSVLLKDGGMTTSGVTVRAGGDKTLMIAIADATTYTVLAADSGKIHVIPDLTADIVITMPTAAAGLFYEFWTKAVAIDSQDWQFDTGLDVNFYLGGLMQITSGTVASTLQAPDGNSNSIMNILTPEPGTLVKMYCDGTNWILNGTVLSNTADAVTWADQS